MRPALANVAETALIIVLGVLNFGWVLYPPLGMVTGGCGMLALGVCIVAALWRRPRRDD
jgi:hypothetical protein